MDHKTILESVKKTNRLVILEEAWPFGNVSTEICYQVQNQIFDYLDAPIEKINTADTPAPFSPKLLDEWLPNSESVIKAVKNNNNKNFFSVAGGGDTISTLNHAKASDYFSFISTGGGAFLEFIQGSGLPGLDSLND